MTNTARRFIGDSEQSGAQPASGPNGFSLAIVATLLLVASMGCGVEQQHTADQQETPESAGTEPESVESILARVGQEPGGAAVLNALDAAGGLAAWQNKSSVRYRKLSTWFDKDGDVERQQEALHTYRLKPTFGVRIEWTDPKTQEQTVLLNDGTQAWKLVNGKEQAGRADRNQAYNSTYGSHYVFSQPFKLADPGTHLDDLGETTLANGRQARGVRVTYDQGVGSAGGDHTWTYWFALDDQLLAANHLVYGSGNNDASYTEYTGHQRFGDLSVPTKRVGYDAKRDGEQAAMTTSYENQDIEFDVEISAEMFRPPG